MASEVEKLRQEIERLRRRLEDSEREKKATAEEVMALLGRVGEAVKKAKVAAKGPAAADVIEAMGDGLIVTDLDGNIISVNRAMEEYLAEGGVEVKKFIGKSALDLPFIRPEDVGKCAELMKEVIEKGRAGPLEVRGATGRWDYVTASLLRDAEGNPSALFAVVRNITELKRAEQERVRAEREAARAKTEIIGAMPDALLVLGLDGRITSSNPALLKMFGFGSLEEVLGKEVSERSPELRELFCDPEKDLPKLAEFFKGVIEKGLTEKPFEVRLRRVDGKEFVGSVSVGLLRDPEGNPKNIIAVLRDTTELTRAEAERVKAIERAKAELERAYEELAVLDRARTFAFILFTSVVQPLLKECGRRTRGKLRDQIRDLGKRLPIAKAVMVGYDGSLTLDEVSIREALAGKTHEEATRDITSTFSEIMRTCDPIIRADIGDERATATISKAFSSLFERPEVSTYRSDLVRLAPDGVEIPREYILLEPRRSYLVEERKPVHAFRIFSEAVKYGSKGLCVTTLHPEDAKRDYGLWESTVMWLSKHGGISPASLGILRDTISRFIERAENTIVLLEGLEYLITTNGFDLTLKFLHDLTESITLNRSRLIVPVSPPTLEARQLALLERHLEPIEIVEE